MDLPPQKRERHIVFCGETGSGKSSAINLLLDPSRHAPVHNNTGPCTLENRPYGITLNDEKYTLWDTPGLGEARSWLRFFGLSSSPTERKLKTFLKDRHQKHEFDLLVYCVRGLGARSPKAATRYYSKICAITRQLAAPVVILVTYLEQEADMENWWERNSGKLDEAGMGFDDHACITTLQDDTKTDESKRKLAELISGRRNWQAEDNESYFSGIQVPSSTLPRRKSFFRRKTKPDEMPADRHLDYPPVPSWKRNSSYYTAPPGSSAASSPVSIQPPTPSSTTPSSKLARIDTNVPEVRGPSQSSGEESGGTKPSLYSLHASSHSSHTLSSTGENEDYLMDELPFKLSTADVVRTKAYATRQGYFGDVWECTLVSGETKRKIAVKAVKTEFNGRVDIKKHEKKLRRELKVWSRVNHENIVPLIGIVSEFGPLPSMVSPWYDNGSLSAFLEKKRRTRSERHRLLVDIAAGLSYLHSGKIVHGDLHSGNVLIDDDGKARLTDFGLSFASEFIGTSYLSSSICGAMNFADPALFQLVSSPGNAVFVPTMACDVYSFGGLMLHVLSGKIPFEGVSTRDIINKISEGERPKIPTDDPHTLTIPHRSLILRCWDREEYRRPSAHDLVRKFTPQ